MKKLKLYLDTAAINFLFEERDLIKRQATEKLFKEIAMGKYEAFISTLVIEEIERAQEPKRSKLLEVVRQYKLQIVEESKDSIDLADLYVKQGIIPQKYIDDARHLAIASREEMDALISWNLRHLVKTKTRRETSAINKLQGYHELDIATPEEVISSD